MGIQCARVVRRGVGSPATPHIATTTARRADAPRRPDAARGF